MGVSEDAPTDGNCEPSDSVATNAPPGSLGTMLQEMAVAVARLDATLYSENCHLSAATQVPPESKAGVQPSMHTLSPAPSAHTPPAAPAPKALEDTIVVSRAAPCSSSHTSETPGMLTAAKSRIIKTYKCTSASTACSVSTAASIASEASGSEIVSDTDTSQAISGPPSSRRHKSSVSHRHGIVTDFFTSRQSDVGCNAGQITRHRRASNEGAGAAPGTLRIAASRPDTSCQADASVPVKSSPPASGPSSKKPLSSEKHREGGIASPAQKKKEPGKRAGSTSSNNECALCGGLIDGPSGLCFCTTCATRLEILDG